MIYATTTNRLALRCDRPGCTATYHPRREARFNDDLRALAWRQGWEWAHDGVDLRDEAIHWGGSDKGGRNVDSQTAQTPCPCARCHEAGRTLPGHPVRWWPLVNPRRCEAPRCETPATAAGVVNGEATARCADHIQPGEAP